MFPKGVEQKRQNLTCFYKKINLSDISQCPLVFYFLSELLILKFCLIFVFKYLKELTFILLKFSIFCYESMNCTQNLTNNIPKRPLHLTESRHNRNLPEFFIVSYISRSVSSIITTLMLVRVIVVDVCTRTVWTVSSTVIMVVPTIVGVTVYVFYLYWYRFVDNRCIGDRFDRSVLDLCAGHSN